MENRTVSINKARVKDEIGAYVVKQTKTYSGERTLHLPDVLLNALGEAGKPDEYVIDDSPDALGGLYDRFRVKIGFPYNFHALRHYYASVMLQSGIPNRYAKERMGHSTENIYLADRANENNECWPAIPTIAANLKYSPSAVRRGIRDLERAGFLATEQRYREKGGKSSLLFKIRSE